jgi:glycosyltransferase involved in cell wall biosynthesis
MRALAVTNSFPTPTRPDLGVFVADQILALRDAGVEIDMLHVNRAGGGRQSYRRLAGRARAAVADREPDVVHVLYGGVMADVVTRATNAAPVLVSFCGSDILGGRSAHGVARAAAAIGVVASRRAARRAAGIIVKSRNLLEKLPSAVPKECVWVVPNGVDLERFRPADRDASCAALGLDAARRHVLFPAAPERPEKRFALAEAAVAGLRSPVELHALAGRPHEEVPLWLNAVDAVLLTSAYEGSPNAVKEALACNTPVVSVDVGDVRERVEGVSGCAVVDADAAALAEALAAVLARGERTDGRRKVRELSQERVAQTVAEIYAELARRSRAVG